MDLAAPTVEAQLFRRTQLKVPHSGDDYVTKQVQRRGRGSGVQGQTHVLPDQVDLGGGWPETH